MAERISPDDQRLLAENLKQEASASRPAFSESLHERICRAVTRDKARALLLSPDRWWSRRRLQATVAAACVLTAGLLVWWLIHPPGPTPVPPEVDRSVAETVDPLEGLDELATAIRPAEIGLLVDSTLTTGRWAYLDHDAQTAARLLIDQLPFDPPGTAEP